MAALIRQANKRLRMANKPEIKKEPHGGKEEEKREKQNNTF